VVDEIAVLYSASSRPLVCETAYMPPALFRSVPQTDLSLVAKLIVQLFSQSLWRQNNHVVFIGSDEAIRLRKSQP
jgi:hypothetical protein